jgi:hypothetical protein
MTSFITLALVSKAIFTKPFAFQLTNEPNKLERFSLSGLSRIA